MTARENYAICKIARVIYYPAPKNAGSTTRDYLFSLENGRPYQNMFIQGREIQLYHLYGCPGGFARINNLADSFPGFECFTIARDPVERFLSAYSNRIYDDQWRDLKHEIRCKRLGLDPRPDIDEFTEKIKLYRRLPDIQHHTNPQHYFIGKDLAYYHRVFRIEELEKMKEYLDERAKTSMPMPRHKAEGKKLTKKDVSLQTQESISRLYQEDYALLSGLYIPPRGQRIGNTVYSKACSPELNTKNAYGQLGVR